MDHNRDANKIQAYHMCHDMRRYLNREPSYETMECFLQIIRSGYEKEFFELLKEHVPDETEISGYWLKFYITGLISESSEFHDRSF